MLLSIGKTSRSAYSRRRRGRGKKQSQNYVLPAMVGGVSLAALGAFGYFAYADMNTAKPDEFGCFAVPNQSTTTVLVDSSQPHMDTVQGKDFIRAIKRVYERMDGNEKLQIINTELDTIGSIPNPVVSVCAPARTPAELETLGASSATQSYLDRESERVFATKIAPALEKMAAGDASNPQAYESPLFEQMQGLSRLPEVQDGEGSKTLIIVSDMIQNTFEAQFCNAKGHMPSFKKFKKKAYFERVKPHSLNGVDVRVLMLIRPDYGKYCKGEDEVRAFWSEYFAEAGADSVEFIRLRFDASGGQ